eukprot:jgi/Tetstr1/438544/TSEL_027095.t1
MTEGSLGRCALVAVSARLTGGCGGSFIDSHDTVIRLGHAPTRHCEAQVGVKKSINKVILIGSGVCKVARGKPGRESDLAEARQPQFWMLDRSECTDAPGFDWRGRLAISSDQDFEPDMKKLITRFMRLARTTSMRAEGFKPSGGLRAALQRWVPEVW